MGTGSESRQMANPREGVAGSVPVPFFHAKRGGPKKGTGTVGNPNHHRHALRRRSQSPFSCSEKKQSRGFALLMILVCLMIASAMLASIFKSTTAMQRFTQRREWRIQAQWLVESGVERAAAKLAENDQYNGETWLLSGDQLGGTDEALVTIEVTVDPGQPRRRLVSVRADYPNHPLHRASINKQIAVQLPEKREQ